MTAVHVLGVRHHGPGSARAVGEALRELAPDVVVIEGPPELDGLVGLAASPQLVPPIAGLAYVPDEPRRAAFYPMAAFSPEWVALRWAVDHGAAVRFADLPAVHALAARHGDPGPADDLGGGEPVEVLPRLDPLGTLAAAAGFDDPERWWEDVIEHRHHGLAAFAVVAEAMVALREVEAERVAADLDTLRREAAMRQVLRAVVKEGPATVAVVCGAWHAPVLHPGTFPAAAADKRLLSNLPKVKVAVTWVPWTSDRLAQRSGYGAGVASPGWYRHQFAAVDEPVVRWMVDTSRALRRHQLDVSPASTIEAVRLAGALALVRDRPAAGLGEVVDATRAVLCGGSDVPWSLVAEELLVGRELGSVPDDAPMVPLARDLQREQKVLKLRPSAAEQLLVLDLRTPTHLARSTLFHRLGLLGVRWANPADTGRTGGTFKEAWTLVWSPELDLAVIEAARLGTTVAVAATRAAADRAAEADLPSLCRLVEETLLADLPDAREAAIRRVGDRAAEGAEVTHLLHAVEPLARVRRYGDVRGTDTEAVHHAIVALVARAAVGLPPASVGIADDLATEVLAGVDAVQRALGLLGDPELDATWLEGVGRVADHDGAHGLLAGRANRLLLDGGRIAGEEVARRLGLVLSLAGDPARGAAWIEGFLAGDDAIIVHDPVLLGVVDSWLGRLSAEVFADLLPLLRRSFGSFPRASRRQLGRTLGRLHRGERAEAVDDDLDEGRAARVEPVVRHLLGGAR